MSTRAIHHAFRAVAASPARLVFCLLLLILLPLVAHTVAGWVSLVVYPGEANFGEGILVQEARYLRQGINIYGDITQSPYWVTTYPPLFQLLVAPLSHAGMWWPRTISLLATLCQLFLLVRLLRHATGSYWPGALACALWVISPVNNAWCVLGRTDTLGRCLETAGVACALLASTPRRALAGSVAFNVLAMMVKQNMIAGGIVSFVILMQRGRRLGLGFGALWVAGTTALYGVLHIITGGGFLKHLLGYTSRPLELPTMWNWIAVFCDTHTGYIYAAVPGLVLALGCRAHWWLAAALLAGVPNAILSGNAGADRNYFIDLLWGLCLLVPYGVHVLASLPGTVGVARRLVWATVLPICVVMAMQAYEIRTRFRMVYPDGEARAQARRVIKNLRETPGPVLSEVVGDAMAAGKPQDVAPYGIKMVYDAGNWDPAPVVRRVQNREYGAVLLTIHFQGRYPEPILRAIFENYDPVKEFPKNYLVEDQFSYYLFRPKADDAVTTAPK